MLTDIRKHTWPKEWLGSSWKTLWRARLQGPFSQQRPMRTNILSCLGLCTNGWYESGTSLLAATSKSVAPCALSWDCGQANQPPRNVGSQRCSATHVPMQQRRKRQCKMYHGEVLRLMIDLSTLIMMSQSDDPPQVGTGSAVVTGPGGPALSQPGCALGS